MWWSGVCLVCVVSVVCVGCVVCGVICVEETNRPDQLANTRHTCPLNTPPHLNTATSSSLSAFPWYENRPPTYFPTSRGPHGPSPRITAPGVTPPSQAPAAAR